MGIRVAELKVILQNRKAFELFMGWLVAVRQNISEKKLESLLKWYMHESDMFTKPVRMKARIDFLQFYTLLLAAQRANVTIFCEEEVFRLVG